MQGFRLEDGHYVRIEADEEGRLASEKLGLILEARGEEIRLFDPAVGEYLRSPAEAEADRLWEKQRADAAEAELERLRAELDAMRRQQE